MSINTKNTHQNQNQDQNQNQNNPYNYPLAAMLVPGLARDYWQRVNHSCVLSMREIFTASYIELKQKSFSPKLIKQILSIGYSAPNKSGEIKLEQLEQLEQSLIANKIKFISIESAEYPEKLRFIPDPPLGLFVKGNSKLLNQRQLAIVGSRKATRQALNITQSWAKKIAQNNIVITSGMALGVDAAAHLGALEAKLNNNTGPTIAVLGCGLQHIYPRQHWQLWQKIIDAGGAIVSEYLPDTSAKAQYFPQRNRIISGMSEGVIVIEAAVKSGSLITARLANEQGREIFALPGSVCNSNTSGCHYLIQQGAKLVTKIQDVFEEYTWGIELENTKASGSQANPEKIDKIDKADKKENKVIAKLLETETSIDEIVEYSGLAFAEVCSILLQLEIKGVVKKSPNGYQKII